MNIVNFNAEQDSALRAFLVEKNYRAAYDYMRFFIKETLLRTTDERVKQDFGAASKGLRSASAIF
ncbi:hypothetical protein [Pseudomonas rhodesiae]|uniref:hypothetical protein n=1 Tax=Pseudomonas rhodesiae TaxID=76760 RepID=UPI00058C756F|nr:hypothetical protein [Pseudomonas rhodesiae]